VWDSLLEEDCFVRDPEEEEGKPQEGLSSDGMLAQEGTKIQLT
jgi:hypothetical protein